jgi:hypothetical protein
MDWAYSPHSCDLVPTTHFVKGRLVKNALHIWLAEDGLRVGRYNESTNARETLSGPYETVAAAKFAAEFL